MADLPAISDLRSHQFIRFRALLERMPSNHFYQRKYEGISVAEIRSFDDLHRLPFTTKKELTDDQLANPPYGTNHARSLSEYVRLHQTSGTMTGSPLRWLDTAANWEWMLDTWKLNFHVMGIAKTDRIAFPFSFGPFLGFWTGFEAATRMGAMVIPCGGMSTIARLQMIREHSVTVVCCTPTYAMHMAEVAEAEGFDLPGSSVRAIVVAGEPGGGLPAVRKQMAEKWGARVFDHYGLTETGPMANESVDAPGGLFALESEFIIEVIEPGSDRPVAKGTPGELVVTNLGRVDSPLIRYRTGDIVQLGDPPAGAKLPWAYFPGGIRGRVDDMIHIRGNNFYPTAIEEVVRRFPEVAEFRIVLDRSGPLASLTVEVEWKAGVNATALHPLERAIRDALLFRAEVIAVAAGSLPRSEMKSRRVLVRPS
jgi:phenylacetate-CoA ligase